MKYKNQRFTDNIKVTRSNPQTVKGKQVRTNYQLQDYLTPNPRTSDHTGEKLQGKDPKLSKTKMRKEKISVGKEKTS
jgi:hypothetical protein